jgi:hypothetical protein
MTTPKLLSGGNPQIEKGYGDAPVRAYVAAIPGWKHDAAARVDALVERTVPGVQRAIKWNSPFYGHEKDIWFFSFHCFDRYLKLTFFRGQSLDPVPPEPSKSGDTRYFHIREGDDFEDQLADWIAQASKLPGEKL